MAGRNTSRVPCVVIAILNIGIMPALILGSLATSLVMCDCLFGLKCDIQLLTSAGSWLATY